MNASTNKFNDTSNTTTQNNNVLEDRKNNITSNLWLTNDEREWILQL